MRRGRQEADDGSFARSVGVHTARGALLIGIAVLLGLVLLQKVDTGRPVATRVRNTPRSTLPPTTAPRITTTTRAPKDVKVLVANGTTTNGVALTAQKTIAQNGYNALAPADATAAAKAAKRPTIVYYAAGYDVDARRIAALLGLTPAAPVAPMPSALPVTNLVGANVLVLVGPDYGTKQSGATTSRPTTAGPTTSTTRRL